MIGIYKITSPKGRVYIGQSVNIKKRFSSYFNLRCIRQPRLYNSFLKYGVLNHNFSIICECGRDQLNLLERHYQDKYNVMSRNGLNCMLTDSGEKQRVLSEKTKEKLRGLRKGVRLSDETKRKIGLSGKGRKNTDESKKKMSEAVIGRRHTPEAIARMRVAKVKQWEEWRLRRDVKLKNNLKLKFMSEIKEEKKVETVEKVELCAIERNVVINRLQKLYEANKDVFEEYDMLLKVLNTQVNIVDESDSKTEESN
jgi:group I intron endonuclease